MGSTRERVVSLKAVIRTKFGVIRSMHIRCLAPRCKLMLGRVMTTDRQTIWCEILEEHGGGRNIFRVRVWSKGEYYTRFQSINA